LAVAVLCLGSAALAVYAARASHSRHLARAALAGAGNLRKPLRPGSSQPVNVVLTNRYRFAVWVTRLRVGISVRPLPGRRCSARRDFAVRQLNRRAYPLRLPRRSRYSLRRLRVSWKLFPRVAMRDLPRINQDGCQRASVRVRYAFRVRRTRPRGKG
jgi:hypothetical protein